jgi:cytochrome c oxidase subunit 4
MANEHAHPPAAHDGEHSVSHVVPVRIYLLVLAALMFLLVLTVAAAFFDFDRIIGSRIGGHYWSMTIALMIAFTKAILIMLFFMHIKYSSKITAAFAASAFVWLGIMFVLSFSDYMTRPNPEAAPSKTAPMLPSPEIQRPASRHDSEVGQARPPDDTVASVR